MTSAPTSIGSAFTEEAEQQHKAVRRGLELVSRRQRTESDLRERLSERFDEQYVEHAITRLTELDYIDDAAWAISYVGRTRSMQASASLLRRELLRAGVSAEQADAALDEHDDHAAALHAAERRIPSLRRLTPEQRSRRLTSYLQRRGFNWPTVQLAMQSALSAFEAAAATSR
jgi:regulatory protein